MTDADALEILDAMRKYMNLQEIALLLKDMHKVASGPDYGSDVREAIARLIELNDRTERRCPPRR